MKISIIGNLSKKGLLQAVSSFLEKLERAEVEYLIEEEVAGLVMTSGRSVPPERIRSVSRCSSEGEILVAFGGDGTILSAARSVGTREIPILGINLGKLGFLAEIAPDEIDTAIDDLLNNRFIVEERSLIEGKSDQFPEKILFAVNDIVLAKGRSSRMIDLRTSIDGTVAVTYRGDGLILSTPTGSTAYALSNGGPIVTPGSRVFGLTPISPHTLSGRPLIVPDGSRITITSDVGEQEVLISVDGQEEELLTSSFELRIRKADHVLRLVKLTGGSYFSVLRAKLFWGKDPRSV